MRRALWRLGIALALAVLAFVVVPVVSTQTTQCAGSFVPGNNCIISGWWNFTNTSNVGGFSPFRVNGAPVTGIVSATVDVSNASVLTLGTTTVTIVPAPPQGYAIDVVSVDAFFKYTATYSGGSNLKLFYGNRTSGSAASSAITVAGFLTGVSANQLIHVAGTPDGTTLSAQTAVVLQGTTLAAFTGGNTANVVRVVVWYRLVATGL